MKSQPNKGVPGTPAPEYAATLHRALARADLTPKARTFLQDVERRARRWPLTSKQAAAVARIADAPDFAAVNGAALARLPDVLARLLPGGRVVGVEYECASLGGGEGSSLRVNLRTGRWADFAVAGAKGGDPVSLAAAVTGRPPAEAAHGLARMLGLGGAAHG